MNNKKYLVTSALPYVNNVPHLGNIIGSVLSGDVYSRFRKLQGHEVLYLCGTDEYGTTTEMKALQEKLSCEEICAKYRVLHKEIYDLFNIKFDVWGQTTTDTQTQLAREIFTDLYNNNHIEEKETEQFFCESCSKFLADRYLQGLCYHDECKSLDSITNGDQCDKCGNLIEIHKLSKYWCSRCKNIPVKKKSKHLYLKLQDFEKDLIKYFLEDKTCKLTQNAYAITKSWLDNGLDSRCITRDLKWGIPVPNIKGLEEYKNKVFYVWFDAPIGYLSILKHARPNDWKEWMTGNIVQFMAKDNCVFHTVIYPATLMGTNNKYPIVTQISATEYLLFENQKFSKSKQIGIFGDEVGNIIKKYGINEDYFRYYLIKIRPETADSSFNFVEFTNVVSSDLCNKIGNLINRCISMTHKYFPNQDFVIDMEHDKLELSELVNKYVNAYDDCKLKEALTCCLSIAEIGNKYLQIHQPWVLYGKNINECKRVLGSTAFICYLLLKLLSPIIPATCDRLLKNICSDIDVFGNAGIESDNYKGEININIDNYAIPFKPIK